MMFGDLKKALEIFCRVRPSLDRQKVDNLNEEFGVTFACFPNSFDQLLQSRQKSVVTDSQQRPAGYVAHAGSFNHQCSGLSFREPSIPIQILWCDKSIFSRTPWDHGRHPGTAFQGDRPDADWLKQKRSFRFFRRGPARFRNRMFDWARELPHAESLYHELTFLECAGRAKRRRRLGCLINFSSSIRGTANPERCRASLATALQVVIVVNYRRTERSTR